MHKWKITVFMKSDIKLTGIYEGPETNSGDVAKCLINGDINTAWFGIKSINEKSNLIIRLSEIMAVDIYPMS